MYEEHLKHIGLTDNETRIYLLLLENEMLSAFEISQKLSLHRGYIYDALERMQEKEAVSSLIMNSKKYFQATTPKNLLELQKIKLENFQNIIPGLTQMINLQKEETRVELHKGKNTFKTLLKDVLSQTPENKEIFLVGVDENIALQETGELFFKQYFKTLQRKNIKEKVIIKKGATQLTEEFTNQKTTLYKEIDEEYLGNVLQIIYGNKVGIFLLGNPRYVIIIESKDVAETYKKQFKLLWSFAK